MMRQTICAALALTLTPVCLSAETQIAVAANSAEPIRAIVAVLEESTGHRARVSLGATGKLYAQIKSGAPFDLLLSANSATPALLEKDGLAQPGSRFTYAIGKLVLWSPDVTMVDAQGAVLKGNRFRKLAYANPASAPYGEAALQTMTQLGLVEHLMPKLVQGESIGQTFSFVHTGNAELGFVALSQVRPGGQSGRGSKWVVPQALYSPIRQDAVLLKRGANNPAALALLQLLKSPAIQDLIRSYGYDR
jgi:molybdate transport system substrate-binding protein